MIEKCAQENPEAGKFVYSCSKITISYIFLHIITYLFTFTQ